MSIIKPRKPRETKVRIYAVSTGSGPTRLIRATSKGEVSRHITAGMLLREATPDDLLAGGRAGTMIEDAGVPMTVTAPKGGSL